MRYEVDRDQKFFFEKNGYIEFEGVEKASFAQIASTLMGQPTIRFGFEWDLAKENPLPKKPCALKEVSSIVPIVCAAIVEEEGKVLFLSPTHRFAFHEIENGKAFGYTARIAVINFNPLDPSSKDLKKLGYAAGDRLKNETHPIIFSE